MKTKIWKLKNSKSNKLIIIHNKTIYKGNIDDEKLNIINIDTFDVNVLKSLFSIPYSYIRKIENQKEKKNMKIYFGDASEEEFIFNEEQLKNELFNFIRNDNPNLLYSYKVPSKFDYAKPQSFALIILSLLFLWSLYLAIQIEDGTQYKLIGGGTPGITAIVLVIANLGSLNIIIGYLIVVTFILFSLKERLKTRTITEYLKR